MKNSIVVSLLALFCNAVTVSANCQSVTMIFNFKPKFPYGNSAEYVCGDLEEQDIETLLKNKLNALLKEFEIDDVKLGNMKTDNCPSYQCSEHPGHKCLPHCIDMTICGFTDLAAWTTLSITDEQIQAIQTQAIDELRNSIPDCLGIKNQFMMDVHASLAGLG